jgi:Peptidase family M28/PDZ domain/PA domain
MKFLPFVRIRPAVLAAGCLLAAAALGWLLPQSQGADGTAASESRLRETVSYLASDELEGRGVGTAGINKAADYIAAQFAKLGLRTNLYNGTPFQEFEITISTELGPAAKNRLAWLPPPPAAGSPPPSELKLAEDFTPLAIGGSGTFDAPLVFAGYGITAKDLKMGDQPLVYDDYAGIDAKDKVVIVIRKEPRQKDPQSPFDGERNSPHATFQQKLANANEHGAAAVILVNDGEELATRREASTKALHAALNELAELRGKLSQEPLEKLAEQVHRSATAAAEASQVLQNTDTLLPFQGAGGSTRRRSLPVFFCTRAAIDRVLKAARGKDLAAMELEIDSDLKPRSTELTGWRGAGESQVVEKQAPAKNVLGVLEGSGPLANETIVIGAHYDHLGLGGEGSLAPWTAEIHNGADDNASGTATLIEVAQRLIAAPARPRRRIVFIAFTGEERGLHGSAHYTREPRFPLENTIAMFNLDMVGRLTDDKLAVYGTGTATEFDPLVERLCREQAFQISKHPGGYGPSDHASFYAKKIPVLHLFTGNHGDYHRPSDDAEKLNISGMRRVADLLVELVRATDQMDTRPSYVEIRSVEQLADSPSGDRPSFGSMPAYPNPAPDGVLLEAVMAGSPADRAGIRGGDVLQRLGDSKITVLEDFESALRKYKPGDKVQIVVRRGQEKIEAEVTLGRRRAMP